METNRIQEIYPSIKITNAKKSFLDGCEEQNISESNKELIDEHITDRKQTKSLKEKSVTKFYYTWTAILKHTTIAEDNKPLEQTTTQDIKKWINQLTSTELSEWTKDDYIQKLKIFYKYVKKNRPINEETRKAIEYIVEDYRFKMEEDKLTEASLVTETDVVNLMDTTDNPSKKAFFSVLFMSGCRIGEVLTLQIQDVTLIPAKIGLNGYFLRLRKSKTVKRPIPILDDHVLNATRHLRRHLQMRKRTGAKPEEPLFVNDKGNPLLYANAKKWLLLAGKHANIKKRLHFHAFRKGMATKLANEGWTNAQLNKYFGWKQGSKTSGYYINNAGIDLIDKMAKTLDLRPEQRAKEEYITCKRCGTKNDKERDYCSLCEQPVNDEVLRQVEQAKMDIMRKEMRELLNEYRIKVGLPVDNLT